ncbi:MAG TPA: tRNA pseudouridine(55) synthase TruB, partial [Fimbriimonadaceae bacterium]|nr:tRNA pseudouridine(55) synthase TruB [Fimbriimonadaceae bacterium]
MLGILLVHKPDGVTSHDVVDVIRRRFGTRRVGHAGTLDPLATGLLVVAVGPATRFLQYLPLEPKVYEGVATFGAETNTQDSEGEVLATGVVPLDLQDQLLLARSKFVGLIQQLPPMFSAVKKGGKPLYVLARQGQEIERDPRTVHIGRLEFDWNARIGNDVPFTVECSGGTYVRTLAHDVGREIGCGAYLSKLVRTEVGRFRLDHARPLDEVQREDLIPLAEALPPMRLVTVAERDQIRIRQGQSLRWDDESEGTVGLLDSHGEVFGVGKIESGR